MWMWKAHVCIYHFLDVHNSNIFCNIWFNSFQRWLNPSFKINWSCMSSNPIFNISQKLNKKCPLCQIQIFKIPHNSIKHEFNYFLSAVIRSHESLQNLYWFCTTIRHFENLAISMDNQLFTYFNQFWVLNWLAVVNNNICCLICWDFVKISDSVVFKLFQKIFCFLNIISLESFHDVWEVFQWDSSFVGPAAYLKSHFKQKLGHFGFNSISL